MAHNPGDNVYQIGSIQMVINNTVTVGVNVGVVAADGSVAWRPRRVRVPMGTDAASALLASLTAAIQASPVLAGKVPF